MDKLTHKKAILDNIRISEGSGFEYDENAILKDYNILEENKSSLSIKILSILGGFLATVMFLLFIGFTGFYDSKSGLMLFGVGFIIFAILLNKFYSKLSIDTFSISIYITGLSLLSFGLLEMDVNENTISLIIIFIALCSLIITQNFIFTFISIITINSSFIFLIEFNKSYNLIYLYLTANTLFLTYLFLNEAKIFSFSKRLSRLYNPMRISLIFSLLFGLILVGKKDLILMSQNLIWLPSIVMILVTLYLIYKIIEVYEIGSTKSKTIIYAVSLLILTPIIFSPSILGAIVIILLSFFVNYKTGLAIGIISMIYFISQYYYDLNFTLLTKSIILFISGIMFLLLYLFTTKTLNNDEKI